MQLFLATILTLVLSKSIRTQTPTCSCVAKNTCYQNITTVPTGVPDVRIINVVPTTVAPPIAPSASPGVCNSNYDICCSGLTGCGLRFYIPPTPTSTPGPGQAQYGSQPWQGIILGLDNTYIGGAVLLDTNNVLTVAHKVVDRAPGSIKIRLGEWNASASNEPYSVSESLVSVITVHPLYNPSNLVNDIAVMKLATPAVYSPVINNICLPATSMVFDMNRCLVAGWGKDSYTGNLQSVEKEVDVPVVPQAACQTALRATRMGSTFVLDPSFMCAGGELGKDACTGDGGAGLGCIVGGKYYLDGLVAWGVGCGNASIPGVYVNVQMFTPWIINVTSTY